MRISLRGWLVLAAFALAACGLVVGLPHLRAADDEAEAAGKLTTESLTNLLEAMGLKATRTEGRYDFSFQAKISGQKSDEDWTLSMSTVLSNDGATLWVMAWLDELPKSAKDVPRRSLLRLLAENDKLGNGKFFAYIPGNRRFVLQRVIPNQNITTAYFRETLEDLGRSVAGSYGYWSVQAWNLAETAPDAAASPAAGDKPDASRENAPRPTNRGAPTGRTAVRDAGTRTK